MATATPNLGATAPVSKIDATDWTRELWLEAFAMARRMIRDRAGHGIGAAYVWYLGHARKRFGASGWRIAQAAGHAVFDRRTVGYAASGSVADLERQGLVRRTRRPRPRQPDGHRPLPLRLVRAAPRARVQPGVELRPAGVGQQPRAAGPPRQKGYGRSAGRSWPRSRPRNGPSRGPWPRTGSR